MGKSNNNNNNCNNNDNNKILYQMERIGSLALWLHVPSKQVKI